MMEKCGHCNTDLNGESSGYHHDECLAEYSRRCREKLCYCCGRTLGPDDIIGGKHEQCTDYSGYPHQ